MRRTTTPLSGSRWRTAKYREAEFALEYERTPKGTARYVAIRNAVETEKLVTRFLYLTANYHVLNFVTQFFERSRGQIHFGLLEDFRHQVLKKKVLDSTRARSKTLSAVLQNGAM